MQYRDFWGRLGAEKCLFEGTALEPRARSATRPWAGDSLATGEALGHDH